MSYDLVTLQRVQDTTRQYSLAYFFWQLRTGLPAKFVHDKTVRPRWERAEQWIPHKPIEYQIHSWATDSLPKREASSQFVTREPVKTVWDSQLRRLCLGKALKARAAEGWRAFRAKPAAGAP